MRHDPPKLVLQNGSHIAVVGGGPAGSFFAIFAKRVAREKNLDIQVTIFDAKDFEKKGPAGCNLCAGVISETLLRALKEEGIILPDEKIQRFVRGYYHRHAAGCTFVKPPRPFCTICTVFRGNGPLKSSGEKNISFDDFLRKQAIASGARLITMPVIDIMLAPEPGGLATIVYRSKGGTAELKADLVVGAFGLNSKLLQKMEQLNFGYKQPKTLTAVHAELPYNLDRLPRRVAERIGLFSPPDIRGLRFGVVTPKNKFLTISLVGKKNLSIAALDQFLQHPYVQRTLMGFEPTVFCRCFAKMPIGAAKHPFTDRLVLIGDASFSRHFKNGIYSAYLTARLAVESAFHSGLSKSDFQQHYYKAAKRMIIRDNYFGRFLFAIAWTIARSRLLMSLYTRLMTQAPQSAPKKVLELFAWNMLTGEIPYKNIFSGLISGRSVSRFEKIYQEQHDFKAINQRTIKMSHNESSTRIANGDFIAVIGGGPGGVGCAITLKTLARKAGMDVRVRLYEAKSDSGIPRYNQCVGVLSPPIREILEDLDIKFPDHLIQRRIDGYVLHSKHKSILLDDKENPSISVRRITFDRYLLDEARKRGIEVVESRVTGLEFHDDLVTLYSESDNIRPAVVVGAFGLDDGSSQMLQRETSYRQPRFLNSIVTKWHPERDFIQSFENNIHAFLPAIKEIEFGAVTPKENHFTINIAGLKVDAHLMDRFLRYPAVAGLFPSYFHEQRNELDYFKGRFPISVAKGMYGHRYITVGDAAGLVRPFKGKGINSALLSGSYAAKVILEYGVSKNAFDEYRKLNQVVLADLPYGKFVRLTANFFANTGMLDQFIRISQDQKRLQDALFNSVSAYKPYKSIIKDLLSYQTVFPAAKSLLNILLPSEAK